VDCLEGAGRVKPIAEYAFTAQPDGSVVVTGGTTPYTLTKNGDGFTCNCPAFKYGHACKHVARWHLLSVGSADSGQRSALGVGAWQAFLPTRTADELVADETLAGDVEWIVPGLLARGALTAVYGIGKGGKGTLATYVAACVVSGAPCLGQAVTAGDVLWLDHEQHERLTRRKLEEAKAFGHAHKVHVYNGPAPDDFARVEATIRKTGALVLGIDSLSRFLQLEDENAAAEVTAQLGRLVDLVHRTNVALLAIHHDRKSGGEHGRGMRGSSAFLAAFDIAVHVKRETDDEQDTRRRLLSVSRYDEANQTLIVRRQEDCSYTVEGSASDVRRTEMLATFSPGDELDIDTVASNLNLPRRTAVRDLQALHGAGKLERRGTGKRGDGFRYSLPESLPLKNPKVGTVASISDVEDRYGV
jgi:AAA domain-containing protein